MTESTASRTAARQSLATRARIAIEVSAVLLLVAALYQLGSTPPSAAAGLLVQTAILSAVVMITRRLGIALPGKGFASFVLGATLFAILLRGWEFAVVVSAIGMLLGDMLLRRMRVREALTVTGHLIFGTGLAGLLYASVGGAVGRAALASSNLGPVVLVAAVYPLVVNGTFYVELALRGHFNWGDAQLTARWEAVVYGASIALALGWLALATAGVSRNVFAVLALALIASFGFAYYVISAGVRADELRMVQGLAGAVAAEVSIERSFSRIQQLTHHLVPWTHMGFARYDAARGEMRLLADTQVKDERTFSAGEGGTAEAVRTGRPFVTGRERGADAVFDERERAGSEVLVPLFQGDQLVGVWSVRHRERGMYRQADGDLLNLLAPQLGLSLALSSLVHPVAESSRQTTAYAHQVASATDAYRAAAEGVAGTATRAKSEAERAAGGVADAVGSLGQLVTEVRETMATAESTQRATHAVADRAVAVKNATAAAADQMLELGRTIGEGAAEVAHLRDAAQDVERFAETIGSIANQTNLLALNATIEAARAGVHGRGFGVVAEEVRKLAEESAQAARNMSRSAQATRRVLDRAAGILEEIGTRLGELAETSTRWRDELSSIVLSAEEGRRAGEQMAQVPRAALDLADRTNAVLSDARAAADRSAQEAASMAGEAETQHRAVQDLARVARELAGVAERLAASVRFIEGDATPADGD